MVVQRCREPWKLLAVLTELARSGGAEQRDEAYLVIAYYEATWQAGWMSGTSLQPT